MSLEGIGAAFTRAREIVQTGVERVQQTVRSVTGDTSNANADSEAIRRVTNQVVAAQESPAPASPATTANDSAPLAHGDHGTGATGGNPAGNDPRTVVTPIRTTPEVTITRETIPNEDSNRQPDAEFVVIDAGDGDDQMQITRDQQTRDVVVNVNGEEHRFTGQDAARLKIRAGDGNDTITVAPDVRISFVIEGGAGDDNITGGAGNDRIEAGAGSDTVNGGDGRDYINGNDGNDRLFGATGNDVIYGGAGDDVLEGNEGNDYLEGSRGLDRLAGNDGNDILSGGLDDDTLEGGAGDDTFYAGQGRDRLYGTTAADTDPANAAGTDRFFAQEEDEVVQNQNSTRITVALTGTPGSRAIRIEGTPEFVERIEADLEMLRSSPNGRQMLDAFDRAYDDSRSSFADVPVIGGMFNDGNTVTIRELPDVNNGYADWSRRTTGGPHPFLDGNQPGPSDDATISYNPQFQSESFHNPVVVLYHEMSHSYNVVTGTFQNGTYTGPGPDGPVRDANGNEIAPGIRNNERQAVGLDNSGTPYDFDGDPNTPPTTANPRPLTENGLRDELRLPPRTSYR